VEEHQLVKLLCCGVFGKAKNFGCKKTRKTASITI